jgi:malonyl CoA-acyl carrier protein transacylase
MKEWKRFVPRYKRKLGEVVIAANYNCPGQLVISGSLRGIEIACERMKASWCEESRHPSGRGRLPFAVDETGT